MVEGGKEITTDWNSHEKGKTMREKREKREELEIVESKGADKSFPYAEEFGAAAAALPAGCP